MLILALDCAGHGCHVAVIEDDVVIASRDERMDRGQDARLMPMIMEALSEAKISFDELDRIAVPQGPGSFTGLRIGLAAARGIGLASGKPVLGIDRFALFRASAKAADKNLFVVIDARRPEMYCRYYPLEGETETLMLTADEVGEFLKDKKSVAITGDIVPGPMGTPAFAQFLPPAEKEVVILGRLAATVDPNDPAHRPQPLYIRPPDVTKKKSVLKFLDVDEEDAALLSELHRESFEASGWNVAQMHGSLALNTTEGWLITQNNVTAGFLLAQILHDQAEILTICVRPTLRHEGIGHQLMQKFVSTLKERGIHDAFLEVAADNAGAIKLYEKNGFRVSGKRPGYYARETANADAVMYRLNSRLA